MKKPFTNQYKRFQLNFDSVTEFAQHIKELDDIGIYDVTADGKEAAKRSRKKPSKQWCMCTSFEEALDMALAGGHWPEGCKDLQKAIADAPLSINVDPADSFELDRIGAAVDVGEYLNNSPECMIYCEPVQQEKPVVTIGVQVHRSFDTPASSALNRGRAIMAVIDALEAQGKRVELWAILAAPDTCKTIEAHIKLKSASQALCLENLAYALGHSAFSRRLGFRLIEAYTAKSTHGCYGGGTVKTEYDINYGYQIGGYDTPQIALREAEETLKEFNQSQKSKAA